MSKTRHIYEVTEISLMPGGDHESAIVLVDTSGPIDLSLQLSRATLVSLQHQLADVLSNPIL